MDAKPVLIAALAGGALWFLTRNMESSAGASGGGSFTLDDLKKLLNPPANTGGGGAGGGTTPASLASLLQAAAGAAAGSLNADEWNYYLGTLPGKTALNLESFAAKFTPNGRPETMPNMTAAEFVAQAGLAGLGNLRALAAAPPRVIVIPMWMARAAYERRKLMASA